MQWTPPTVDFYWCGYVFSSDSSDTSATQSLSKSRKYWSLLIAVNSLEMSTLFDSKSDKILNGLFLSPILILNFYCSFLAQEPWSEILLLPFVSESIMYFASAHLLPPWIWGPQLERCFQMQDQSPILWESMYNLSGAWSICSCQ